MKKYIKLICLMILIAILAEVIGLRMRDAGNTEQAVSETEMPEEEQAPASDATEETVPVVKEEPDESESDWDKFWGHSMLYVLPDLDDDNIKLMYTEDGTLVPDIMSEEIVFSGKRMVNDFPVSGPNIVINGYAVPENDFWVDYTGCINIMNQVFVRYMISSSVLAECGLTPNVEAAEQLYTRYDYALAAADNGSVPIDEIEQHVTFTCEKYDTETNTYYLHATQNGPYSGTSDVFNTYLNGTRVNVFPTGYSEKNYPCLVVSAETGYTLLDSGNKYWNTYNDISRNDLRHMINEKCGTSYEDIEDGDTMGTTDEEAVARYVR